MGTLIDTSILVEVERGRLDLDAQLHRSDQEYLISVITVSELLHGLHRANNAGRHKGRSAFVERIFDQFPVIPVDLEIARTHSRIWAHLSMAGNMIGMNDLWLAATCITHNLKIATANVREFERVPEIEIEVWQNL